MLAENKALALEHARAEYPREACGLLVIRKGREVYARCRNIGVGTDQFVIHAADYAAADMEGEIVGGAQPPRDVARAQPSRPGGL